MRHRVRSHLSRDLASNVLNLDSQSLSHRRSLVPHVLSTTQAMCQVPGLSIQAPQLPEAVVKGGDDGHVSECLVHVKSVLLSTVGGHCCFSGRLVWYI